MIYLPACSDIEFFVGEDSVRGWGASISRKSVVFARISGLLCSLDVSDLDDLTLSEWDQEETYPMKTRRIVSIVLVLVLVLPMVLSGCGSQDVIKIGVLAQLTGADAYVGQAAELALQDRVDEINAAGGINGKTIELVIYDTRSEVTDAVTAANRLIEQDKVSAIIGPEWSGAGIALATIADAAQVPIITTTASNINVTVDEDGNLHPYMFRACFIDPYQGYALADFAYNELGKRSVAFITDVTAAYSVAIQEYFVEHFTELGGSVATLEGYQSGDQEFRAQLSTVADSGADLLVVPTATYRDAALIAKQADALGLDIQFLGVDGWVADELLDMAGPELEGAYLSSGLSTDAPEFQAYNEAFEAKHDMKATVYAYYALDALYMLEYAIGEAGSGDSVAIRDALENMVDVPCFSSNITVEPSTHNPYNKPIILMQITDSQWQLVKTYEPEA